MFQHRYQSSETYDSELEDSRPTARPRPRASDHSIGDRVTPIRYSQDHRSGPELYRDRSSGAQTHFAVAASQYMSTQERQYSPPYADASDFDPIYASGARHRTPSSDFETARAQNRSPEYFRPRSLELDSVSPLNESVNGLSLSPDSEVDLQARPGRDRNVEICERSGHHDSDIRDAYGGSGGGGGGGGGRGYRNHREHPDTDSDSESTSLLPTIL